MKNILFYGDNLEILQQNRTDNKHYIPDGSIDLCYVDPPFNSSRNYNQIYNNQGKEDKAQVQAFIDTWEWDDEAIKGFEQFDLVNGNRSYPERVKQLLIGLEKVLGKGSMLAYLVSLTQRIIEIHRVLKPSGSFYLHCDPTASHYLKLVLDAVFIPNGGEFRNEITWKRHSGHNDAKRYGRIHDIIFFYSKSDGITFNKYTEYDKEYIKKNYRYTDPDGRRYASDNMVESNQPDGYHYNYKGYPCPKKGWRMPLSTMERYDRENRLIFPSNPNGRLRKKTYLDELKGKPLQDFWDDIKPLSSGAKERLGYPTQKPEALLERIIQASSEEGDTVLDAYCGCGTTIAVAQRLHRKWIGIDITFQSISLILKRLEDTYQGEYKNILDNMEMNGIPKDMESAKALTNKSRTRKEFEIWAVMTYSNNKAIPNHKQGADKGIDGSMFIYTCLQPKEYQTVLFSVKSGKVGVSMIRDFLHVIEREQAACGVFITLEEPTRDMLREAREVGKYINPLTGNSIEKLQIVTVKEILEGKRENFPNPADILPAAQKRHISNRQNELF